MSNNQNYYSVMPSFIIADANLTPNAKLLYAVISSLCNQNAVCWATNAYFAEIFKTTEVSVSKWIKELIDNKYIVSGVTKDKNGTHRSIKLDFDPAQRKVNTGIKKTLSGYKENFKENNIIDNSINPVNCLNTSLSLKKSSKKKEKPKDFDEILGYFYAKIEMFESTEQLKRIATDFYEFYEQRDWCQRVGNTLKPLKSWELAANRWIRTSINDERGLPIERYEKAKNAAYKRKETLKTPITDEEMDEILYGKGEK